MPASNSASRRAHGKKLSLYDGYVVYRPVHFRENEWVIVSHPGHLICIEVLAALKMPPSSRFSLVIIMRAETTSGENHLYRADVCAHADALEIPLCDFGAT